MSQRDRREAIIDAAIEVAMENGLGATTVRDVAGRMGSSSGLIHHYFESMDLVLAGAFRRVAEKDLATSRDELAVLGDPVTQLAHFVNTYFSPDRDPAFQFWLDAWSEAGRNGALQQASSSLNVEWQQTLLTIIESGVDSGDFECSDPFGASWSILSLLDGLALQIVAHRTVLSRAQSIVWAAGTIERDLGLPSGALRHQAPVGASAL
ncbi:MAG: TetR family transcriptional regulator C-terminal domain-containing protein [Acidimicrobiia bacterium]|nr:TetR family transcriptional regulator C-terminal domain-containing protein [Acidimicrobiia bacterium]MDH5423113.1 TetR family transcriptional regulator C-terminal domain-containing protein [Acidimicrobiia bacterium]MDH5503960.1 TetR family transcriptional regulator C-terminal domain-containing protein [Acidimicrobiia bacterium]